MDDAVRANYEHNVADALATMPKMAVGLDVNVKFSGLVQAKIHFASSQCTLLRNTLAAITELNVQSSTFFILEGCSVSL